MNHLQRQRWQTAAELFAMSILDICPKMVFKAIRADLLGFTCEFLHPDMPHKDQIDLAVRRIREMVQKGMKIEVLEMVSTNVVDYMKHLRQPLRAKAVDCSHQFTQVVRINDYYADVLEGPLDLDLDSIKAIEVDLPVLAGEVLFHKKPAPLFRIEGVAFENSQQIKNHKKMIQENAFYDHRNTPFQGEMIALWRSIYETFAKALREEGFIEKWRGSTLEEGCFAEIDEPIEDKTEFGLKANGRFRGIKFRGKKCLEKLYKTLPVKENRDIYGIEWPLIEYDGMGKIWIDRITSLLIEQKRRVKNDLM